MIRLSMAKIQQILEKVQDNPIAGKEMQLFIRGKGNLTALSIFVVILFFVALGFIREEISTGGGYGSGYVGVLITILSIALIIIIPSRAAAAISQEKEKRTIDLLLTSLLSPREIILGKFFYPISLFLFLFFLALPFFPLGFLLGALSPWNMFWMVSWLFLGASFISAVSVSLSSCMPKTSSVTGIIIGFFVLFWVIGAPLLSFAFTNSPYSNNSTMTTIFGIMLILWGIFTSLEKASDNLLLEKFRNPVYFKKLCIIGYILLISFLATLIAGNLSQHSSGNLLSIFTLLLILHLLLVPLFPAVESIPAWQSRYAILLTIGGMGVITIALLLTKQNIWFEQSMMSAAIIFLQVILFSLVTHIISIVKKRVQEVRKFIWIIYACLLVSQVTVAIMGAFAGNNFDKLFLSMGILPLSLLWGIWWETNISPGFIYVPLLVHGILILILTLIISKLKKVNNGKSKQEPL